MGNSNSISCQIPQTKCAEETITNTCSKGPAQKDDLHNLNAHLDQGSAQQHKETDLENRNPSDLISSQRGQLQDKHCTDNHQLHHQLAPHFSGACLHTGKLAFKQLKDFRGRFVVLLFVEECIRGNFLEIADLEQTLVDLSCSQNFQFEILVCLPEPLEIIQKFIVENGLNNDRMWIYSDKEKKILKNFMKEKSISRMQGDSISMKNYNQHSTGFALISQKGYLKDQHFFDQDTKQKWNSQSLISLIGQKMFEQSGSHNNYDSPHSLTILESLGGEKGVQQLDILFFQIAQSYPLLNSICQNKQFKSNHFRFLMDVLSSRSNQINLQKIEQDQYGHQQSQYSQPKLELDADSQECYGLVLKKAIYQQLNKTMKNSLCNNEYHKQQQTQSVFLAIKQRMKSIGYSTFQLLGKSMNKMSDMIQEIISKVAADGQLSQYFHDSSAFQQQSQEFQQIHANRVDCFAQCLGASIHKEDGAKPYDLNSLKQAHAHLRLTSKHFSIFLGQFKAGLVSRGISASQADKAVKNLRLLEGQIVSDNNDQDKESIGTYEDSLVFNLGGKNKLGKILSDIHEKIRSDLVFENLDSQRLINQIKDILYKGNYLTDNKKETESFENQGNIMKIDKEISIISDQQSLSCKQQKQSTQKSQQKFETQKLNSIQQEILKIYFYQSCIDTGVTSIECVIFTCDYLFPQDDNQQVDTTQHRRNDLLPNKNVNQSLKQFDEELIQKISSTMSVEVMNFERLSVLFKGQDPKLVQEFCELLFRRIILKQAHKNMHSELQLLGSISIKLHLRDIHFNTVKHCFEQSLRIHNVSQQIINESSILLERIKDYFIFDERPKLLECLGGQSVLAKCITDMLQMLKRQSTPEQLGKNEKSQKNIYKKIIDSFERVSDLGMSLNEKILVVLVAGLEDKLEELKLILSPRTRIQGSDENQTKNYTTENDQNHNGFTDSEFDQFKRLLFEYLQKQGVADQTLLRKVCSKIEKNLRQFLVTSNESLLFRLGGKHKLQEVIAILLVKIKNDDRLVEVFPEKAIQCHKDILIKFLTHRLSKQVEQENPYGFPQKDECCTDSRNQEQYSVDNQCLASTDSDWQSTSSSSSQISWEQRILDSHKNVQQLNHFHVDVFKALLRDSLMQIEADESVIQEVLELHIEPFRSSLVNHIGCITSKLIYF